MADAAHVVDIASLVEQLRKELEAAEPMAWQVARGCSIVIAAVGDLTRNVDPDEYVPHHVSIGPYHHHIPHLARDDEKVRCLGTVLSEAIAAMTLEVYLEELASLGARARSCYAHTFEDMDGAKFVRMLLLDACYVLVHFAGVVEAAAAGRTNGGGGARVDGHVQEGSHRRTEAPPANGHMMGGVMMVRDVLYLAENQIPFFVIDKVYNLTFPDADVSAANAIAGYVRDLLQLQGQEYSFATPAVPGPDELGNFLHLLHMHFTPTSPSSPATGSSELTGGKRRVMGRWRTATEYHFAGVGFMTRHLSRNRKGPLSILDVKLDGRGGALEIPCLNIDAETWRLLRNLVALEQSNPVEAGSNVTAYCVFVSQLACTPHDVELLWRRGVISHGLGSHAEVAEHFADLCKGVAFRADGNYLHATWQALDGRFRCRPRRWAAWLMLRYFSNPWLAVGLAAAAVGLVCTVVQAVCSVLSYAH